MFTQKPLKIDVNITGEMIKKQEVKMFIGVTAAHKYLIALQSWRFKWKNLSMFWKENINYSITKTKVCIKIINNNNNNNNREKKNRKKEQIICVQT